MQNLPKPATTTSTRKYKSTGLLVLALAPVLVGCGNSAMSTVVGYMRLGVLGGADLKLTHADVYKVPYASIGVRLGRGPQAFVVLAKLDGDDAQWLSADKHLIETRCGRITRTIGFDRDLTHTSFLTPDPLVSHLDPGQTYAVDRIVDVTDHTGKTGDAPIDGILVRSVFSYDRAETVTILGQAISTNHWIETITAPDVKWSQTNEYWQDRQSRVIWKSRQNFAPDYVPLEITTLREYFGE
jgi:hypothetical protein